MGLDFVVMFISSLPESCPSFAQWVPCRWKLFSKFSQGLCISVVLLTYYMHALIVCDYVILQMEKRIHFYYNIARELWKYPLTVFSLWQDGCTDQIIKSNRLPRGNASYLSSTLDKTFNYSGRQATRDQC